MRLYVAQTGSAGNTYILSGDNSESLILDAGAPVKAVLPHIPDARKIRGLLITHEHYDHAQRWQTYAKRGITIYGSRGTLDSIMPSETLYNKCYMRPLEDWLDIGEFKVVAFRTQHDATEPTGFLIRYKPTGEQIVYATDTYYLKYTFPGTTYWLVECNYCDDLIGDETDTALRKRLKESHMSLSRLADTLRANDLTQTAKIVLAHLSDTRSDEARMIREIASLTDAEVVAAHNDELIELTKTPF